MTACSEALPRDGSYFLFDRLKVSADLVLRRVLPCSVERCSGRCCRFGALVSTEEIVLIDRLLPRLLPFLRPSARRAIRRFGWCYRQPVHEKYVDSSREFRASRVADGRCVFVLDRDAGGCALHALALRDGLPSAAYKPMECALFPLNAGIDGELHVHRWPGYPCTRHRPGYRPAFYSLDTELRTLFGDRKYERFVTFVEELRSVGYRLVEGTRPDPSPRPRGRPPKRGADVEDVFSSHWDIVRGGRADFSNEVSAAGREV